MNFFLSLLVIVVGGIAYYEYTTEQQIREGCQYQLNEAQNKIDVLQAQNTDLETEKAALNKATSDTEAQVAILTTRLQAAQKAVADQKAAEQKAAATVAPSLNLSTLNLGTITTLLGKTFQNCQLLKVEADGITFSHSDGITKVLFRYLPPDIQKRFGFDPHQAAALDEAEVRYQEELRKAATPPSPDTPSPQ